VTVLEVSQLLNMLLPFWILKMNFNEIAGWKHDCFCRTTKLLASFIFGDLLFETLCETVLGLLLVSFYNLLSSFWILIK